MEKHALVLITIFLSFIFSCTTHEEEKMEALEDKNPTVISETQMKAEPQKTTQPQSTPAQQDEVVEVVEEVSPEPEVEVRLTSANNMISNLSSHEQLLQTLDQSLKIEYADLDLNRIESDTVILANNHEFRVNYVTSCLNDSLVAQEMYDYGGTNAKSYLISHNYRTDVRIEVDGKLTGGQAIDKHIFSGELDEEFLAHSIIKHPEFVEFDKETNEAIFRFMVGVPNTDWLILAGVNMNQDGKVRIIDIQTPGL